MLSREQQEKRTAEEAEYWFKETMAARAIIEQQAAVIRAHCATHAEDQARKEAAFKEIADNADRFQAISDFYNASRKTGYWSDWSIGGVTFEALKKETKKAIEYRAPVVIAESDLQCIGGCVVAGSANRVGVANGALFRSGFIPAGQQYKPVYTLSSDPVRVSGQKLKGVKKSG